MKVWATVSLSLMVASCGAIQQRSGISTPVGQTLTAGVGDVVLRVEGRESMPNALGNADILGRTRPTGFTTIQYGGIQGDNIVLLRSDEPTVPVIVNWRADRRIQAAGRVIVILDATPTSLVFRIE